ncbi:MAG: hypothetical protein ACOC80_04570 [Petrotogales bacterium]
MKNKNIEKAVVFTISAVFIMVACTPAITSTDTSVIETEEDNQSNKHIQANIQPVLSPEEHALIQKQAYRSIPLDRGWYWKPPYDNYAPHTPGGMPDFDQKQDQWKAIGPGPNGVIDSTPAGDDYHNSAENRIVPGPNCKLETAPAGDDIAYWCFCGAVAVANCFWWFDSKYADPDGIPGDGQDEFPLVEDYTAGDDHSTANAPLLIKKLAGYFKTCSKGTTYIGDMQNGIDDWFVDTGLDDFFEENTYNKPTFEFIESEIERSQDVILLLGYYDTQIEEEIDQYQLLCEECEHVNIYGPTWQQFVPTVNSLSRVEVKIARTQDYPNNGNITMTIESPIGNVLTSKTLPPGDVPEEPWCTTNWISFDVPDITLNPGQIYYINLTTPPDIWYHWCGAWGNPYTPGISSRGPEWDWTFKTFYVYGEECVRKGGHYVTCAGVNSEELQIAISDPCWDIQNPNSGDHNDAQNVSHDIYDVDLDPPCSLGYKWWLPDFPSDYYTIVEQAVVICPKDVCCLEIDSIYGGLLGTSPSPKVNAVIKNTGTAACNNVNWSFAFSGGIVIWGANGGTETSISPGGIVNISSNVVIGLVIPGLLPGKVIVKADATNNACPPAKMEKEIFVFFLLFTVTP